MLARRARAPLGEPRHDDPPAVVDQARARPRPRGRPVPPVTIAVRSMSASAPRRATRWHARSAYAVRSRPYGSAMLVRDSRGSGSTRSCSCARRAAAPPRRQRVPAPHARRPQRQVAAIVWDGVEVLRELCVPGAACASRAATRSTRATARRSRRRAARAAPGQFDLADLLDGPPRAPRPDGGRPARAARHHPGPAPARAARPLLGEAHQSWRRFRERAGRQALPPGLPPRPARALACRSPRASARSRRTSRASTTTSRSPARCCTTSASSRPTRPTSARSTSPTPAACRARSRSATTASGARSRSIDGFPPALAQAVLHIILSHHGSLAHGCPVVPVHARGDARAHHRQPRRPARQVRPAREGAAPGSAGRRSTVRSASSAHFGPAVADERRGA